MRDGGLAMVKGRCTEEARAYERSRRVREVEQALGRRRRSARSRAASARLGPWRVHEPGLRSLRVDAWAPAWARHDLLILPRAARMSRRVGPALRESPLTGRGRGTFAPSLESDPIGTRCSTGAGTPPGARFCSGRLNRSR